MELVSIVIPVYNIKDYLRQCIDSIKAQTYENIEILMVDDGSTDGSSELCDELALHDERIVVIHKENGGVSSARNYGIEASNGTYITFIDGDDWVENNYIETLYFSAIEKGADVSAVGYVYQYDNGQSKPLLITDDTVELAGADALNQACDAFRPWVGFAWGKLVRKSLLDQNDVRFDTSIRICEDSLFWYSVFENVKSAVKNKETLYNYRIRQTSATRTAKKSLKALETKIHSFEKSLIIANRYPETTFQYRIQTTLFFDVISYISAMFCSKQYDKSKINQLNQKLKSLKNPHVMKNLSIGVRLRFYIFSISPKVLYWCERVKEKVWR